MIVIDGRVVASLDNLLAGTDSLYGMRALNINWCAFDYLFFRYLSIPCRNLLRLCRESFNLGPQFHNLHSYIQVCIRKETIVHLIA